MQEVNSNRVPSASGGIISAAAVNDAVQAAERDAAFERLARQRAQAELAAAHEQLRQVSAQLRVAMGQIREAQQGAVASKFVERRADLDAKRLADAQSEVSDLQEQLRAARADCSRKSALLKLAQV